jgi:hypothetical protein
VTGAQSGVRFGGQFSEGFRRAVVQSGVLCVWQCV